MAARAAAAPRARVALAHGRALCVRAAARSAARRPEPARDEPRVHDDARNRAAARVQLLAVAGPRVPSRARAAAQQLPRAARAALGRAHAAHHRVRGQRERLGAARPQHLAVDPVRAVDGAEGRRQLQLRVEGGPAAQLRAAFQRVSERHARRPAADERRDGIHGLARERDGDGLGSSKWERSAAGSRG